MNVLLEESKSGILIESLISPIQKNELPLKKDGWQFTWKKLGQIEGAECYKLTKISTPNVVEGMLMLTLVNEEMLYMNNIEVAPHNFGSNGKYERVAASLLAFACYKSFDVGQNHYLGFLSFESKTQLMELYQNKYGATHAMGQKMFFDQNAGKALIKKYLAIEI